MDKRPSYIMKYGVVRSRLAKCAVLSAGIVFGFSAFSADDTSLTDLVNFKVSSETPDATTSTKLGGITSSACSVDHISVDVSYNVAVLGCEFSGTNQGFLIDLNKLALNPSAGTYSLPTTAILPFTLPAYEMDDVAVDSNNHLAFVGSGGYAGTVGYFIGKLNDPRTSPLGFSLTTGSSILSMPVFSSTNVSNCTITGCTPLTIGGQWHGWYDPHAIGAFTDSTGNSIVLWENNTKTAISVINMSEIIAGSSLMPTLSIWYQGLP